MLHVEIKLSGDGEQIGLFAADGVTAVDTLTFRAQTEDISFGRVPDGSDNWQFFENPTPGFTNVLVPRHLYINEFLASNDSCCTDEYGGCE